MSCSGGGGGGCDVVAYRAAWCFISLLVLDLSYGWYVLCCLLTVGCSRASKDAIVTLRDGSASHEAFVFVGLDWA